MTLSFQDFHFGDLEEAARDFSLFDIAVFRGLLAPATIASLLDLTFGRLAATRRDFMMPRLGGNLPPDMEATPRHMVTISGTELNRVPAIHALYHDQRLIQTLGTIVGEPIDDQFGPGIEPCADELENLVATRMEKPGDTHGFHFDTPQIAFIIALEAPPEGMGGELQYHVPVARGYRALDCVYLRAGDAYLLNAAESLHRVTPLRPGVPQFPLKKRRRTIINLTYVRPGTPNTANGSAQLLFG